MFRAVKLKLYPNNIQRSAFAKNAGCCRWLYNHLLEKQIRKYERGEKYLSKFDMVNEMVAMKSKKKYEWLREANSQSLQQAVFHLDQAYKNFFRGVKTGGGTSGFPKFKHKGRRDSFTCVQGTGFDPRGFLYLSKHGWVRCRGSLERLKDRYIKAVTVSKEGDSWYASCLIEISDAEEERLTSTHIHKYDACGVDLGIIRPLTVAYDNLDGKRKHLILGRNAQEQFIVLEERRKRYQRAMARKVKGSKNKEKVRKKVERAFQRERFYRETWIEQTSHKLASRYGTVAFEDLNIRAMTKKGEANPGLLSKAAKNGLNREMLRLGLAKLVTRTEQKAQAYQGVVIKFNPAYSSQTCSSCGYISRKNRKSQAKFQCLECGHTQNADHNAADNALAIAKTYLKAA